MNKYQIVFLFFGLALLITSCSANNITDNIVDCLYEKDINSNDNDNEFDISDWHVFDFQFEENHEFIRFAPTSPVFPSGYMSITLELENISPIIYYVFEYGRGGFLVKYFNDEWRIVPEETQILWTFLGYRLPNTIEPVIINVNTSNRYGQLMPGTYRYVWERFKLYHVQYDPYAKEIYDAWFQDLIWEGSIWAEFIIE